ncbi:helix-turn-helix domain-containing protein [Salmonella enterica]|nr:helix-turn-helix domain-containing protein [Salmonella enterica]
MAGRKLKVDPAAIAECAAAGMSQAATAEKLGISTTAVRYHWKGDVKPAGWEPSKHREDVQRLTLEGFNPQQIAEKLGISKSTVYRLRKGGDHGA